MDTLALSFQGLEVSRIRSLNTRPAFSNGWPVDTLPTLDAVWPPPGAATIIIETDQKIPEPMRKLTGQTGLLALRVGGFGRLLLVRLRTSDKQSLRFEYAP